MLRALIVVVLTVSMIPYATVADEARIQFPADYKTTFTNYLNLDRTQNPDQIIRLYANDIALEGLRASGEFPEGSILMGEIYKAKKDPEGKVMVSRLGRRIKGDLALLAFMEKQKGWGDGRAEGLGTGDWDFAAFKPDGTRAKKDLNECRACHAPLADTRYTFSYEHLK